MPPKVTSAELKKKKPGVGKPISDIVQARGKTRKNSIAGMAPPAKNAGEINPQRNAVRNLGCLLMVASNVADEVTASETHRDPASWKNPPASERNEGFSGG